MRFSSPLRWDFRKCGALRKRRSAIDFNRLSSNSSSCRLSDSLRLRPRHALALFSFFDQHFWHLMPCPRLWSLASLLIAAVHKQSSCRLLNHLRSIACSDESNLSRAKRLARASEFGVKGGFAMVLLLSAVYSASELTSRNFAKKIN